MLTAYRRQILSTPIGDRFIREYECVSEVIIEILLAATKRFTAYDNLDDRDNYEAWREKYLFRSLYVGLESFSLPVRSR